MLGLEEKLTILDGFLRLVAYRAALFVLLTPFWTIIVFSETNAARGSFCTARQSRFINAKPCSLSVVVVGTVVFDRPSSCLGVIKTSPYSSSTGQAVVWELLRRLSLVVFNVSTVVWEFFWASLWSSSTGEAAFWEAFCSQLYSGLLVIKSSLLSSSPRDAVVWELLSLFGRPPRVKLLCEKPLLAVSLVVFGTSICLLGSFFWPCLFDRLRQVQFIAL